MPNTAAAAPPTPRRARPRPRPRRRRLIVDFTEHSPRPRPRAAAATAATTAPELELRLSISSFGPDVSDCFLLGVDVRTLCRMRAVSWAFRRAAEASLMRPRNVVCVSDFAHNRDDDDDSNGHQVAFGGSGGHRAHHRHWRHRERNSDCECDLGSGAGAGAGTMALPPPRRPGVLAAAKRVKRFIVEPRCEERGFARVELDPRGTTTDFLWRHHDLSRAHQRFHFCHLESVFISCGGLNPSEVSSNLLFCQRPTLQTLRLHDASPQLSRRFLDTVPNLTHLEIRSSFMELAVFEAIARLPLLGALDLTNILVTSADALSPMFDLLPTSLVEFRSRFYLSSPRDGEALVARWCAMKDLRVLAISPVKDYLTHTTHLERILRSLDKLVVLLDRLPSAALVVLARRELAFANIRAAELLLALPAHLSAVARALPALAELRLRLDWHAELYLATHADYARVVPFAKVRVLELASFRGQIEPQFLMAYFPRVCMFTISVRKPRGSKFFVPPAAAPVVPDSFASSDLGSSGNLATHSVTSHHWPDTAAASHRRIDFATSHDQCRGFSTSCETSGSATSRQVSASATSRQASASATSRHTYTPRGRSCCDIVLRDNAHTRHGYTYNSLLTAIRHSLPKSAKILCLDSPLDGTVDFKAFIHNFKIDLLRLATTVSGDKSQIEHFAELRDTYFGIPTHMRPQCIFYDLGPRSFLNWERSYEFVWRNLVSQRIHKFLV